jgi:hypothetical protein
MGRLTLNINVPTRAITANHQNQSEPSLDGLATTHHLPSADAEKVTEVSLATASGLV